VNAQEPGRTYRLGGLTPSPRDGPHYNALFNELRRLGIVEGQNLTVDWRGYGFRIEQFPDIAVELVKAKVDVIYYAGDTAIRAAQQARLPQYLQALEDGARAWS
jgi:putative tryptophan/tyrosine transport system substrate-binding protein